VFIRVLESGGSVPSPPKRLTPAKSLSSDPEHPHHPICWGSSWQSKAATGVEHTHFAPVNLEQRRHELRDRIRRQELPPNSCCLFKSDSDAGSYGESVGVSPAMTFGWAAIFTT
jgi:hypothetical protein